MLKNLMFTGLALVAFVGLLAGAKAFQINDLITAGQSMTMPPTAIAATKVTQQQWEVTLPSVGTIEAVQGVIVGADIPGRVVNIEFEPGAKVKAGDVLIRQDISSEQAQLRAALANSELAKANLTRAKELVTKKVASQSELDAASARYQEAVAQADNIKTTIAKKTVVAPFDGHLGIRKVNLGQDLASGAEIVSLQSIDNLHINFSLPQKHASMIKAGYEVRIQSNAVADETFTGQIIAIDSQVDEATRSISVQAAFANSEQKLLPGMYASVEVVMPELETVLAVPITAVAFATFGDSVFVVEEEEPSEGGNKNLLAKQHFVQLGRSMGDYVAITKGLMAGQNVVSAGVFKLRNGAPVKINNDGQPDYKLTPSPNDA